MKPQQALVKFFKLKTFRNSQLEIIEEILKGENVLAVLPTGAGKSICYQIPALISENFSIVISPLISLMKDQVDSINHTYQQASQNEELAAFMNSTMNFYESEEVLQKIAYGKIKLLYVAPEKLSNLSFAKRIKKLSPTFLFIDEAHCISEWGHNFRPSYSKIKEFIDFAEIKNVSGFTATATPEVVKDITKQLGIKDPKLFVRGFERDNLYLNVIITKKKKDKCLELISNYKTPAIIYTSSRKSAEEISEYLVMKRINCSYYHAGMPAEIRKKIQEDFINDQTPIIAATNAFGMGIDKKDIRLIIHYNTPGSVENYYQEIGRAGRDGKNSFTYLLHDDSDINIQNFFISNSHPDKELIQNIYSAICDYGKIEEGDFSENEVPINLEYISAYCKRKINKGLVHSALKILESANYIKQVSEFERNISIQITIDKNSLKEFTKRSSNDNLKDIVLQMLREFGSELFTKKINISIKQLSNKFDLDEDDLNKALITLDNLGIVSYSKIFSKENILLVSPRVNKARLVLDYKKLNESYLNQRGKVDSMVKYVYSNDCRFKFILDYFGEDVKNYKCGRCDKCTAKHGLNEEITYYIKENIIKTISETDLQINEKSLIQILKGKALNNNYSSISSFGNLANHPISEIKLMLYQLIAENKIIKNISNNSLKLSESILVDLNFEEKIGRSSAANYEENLELFNYLRDIRTKASKKFLQKSYLVCPDEVLRKIAAGKPKTETELLSVEGFNNRMFNKVGDDFLEIINKLAGENINKSSETNKIPQNILETYKLLKKGYGLKDISSLRNLSEAVISMQVETIIEFEPGIDVSHLIGNNFYELISKEIEKGVTSLKDLKGKLPPEVSYPIIRIAAAKYKFNSDYYFSRSPRMP
ncbi:MAG: RecQ family ATP-dependent DNA helicase [Ignavibacteriaceae bacterium]